MWDSVSAVKQQILINFYVATTLFSPPSYICLAGETKLSGKFEIVRIDLHPSEQYKSVRIV
jgi:hypothetical protein